MCLRLTVVNLWFAICDGRDTLFQHIYMKRRLAQFFGAPKKKQVLIHTCSWTCATSNDTLSLLFVGDSTSYRTITSHLSACPSWASCLTGCCVTSPLATTSHLLAPVPLVAPLPLVTVLPLVPLVPLVQLVVTVPIFTPPPLTRPNKSQWKKGKRKRAPLSSVSFRNKDSYLRSDHSSHLCWSVANHKQLRFPIHDHTYWKSQIFSISYGILNPKGQSAKG